jgi:signal transduction histidine kinase
MTHPRKAAVRHALAFGLLFMVAVSIVLSAIYFTIESAIDSKTEHLFRLAMIWAVALLAALAAATGYAFSQRLTQRVQAIAETCESIVSGDRSCRLPVSPLHDELDSLAVSVNRVLDQLAELTRTRRTVFDSAAHDLRGPLYRLRNRIESMMRKAAHGTVLPSGLDEACHAATDRARGIRFTDDRCREVRSCDAGA